MKVRFAFAATLCLIMVMTSQAMAVARHATTATGQMVICVGANAQIIYTDAKGAPTAAPHFCPDCALHATVTSAPLDVLQPTGFQDVAPLRGLMSLAIPSFPWLIPQGRAPPDLV